MTETYPIVVAALYHFARVDRAAELQKSLKELCMNHGMTGTLILAAEGINGTVAGSRAAVDTLISYLRAQPEFSTLEHKESFAEAMPFYRLKVRLKAEIVTMGVTGIDPNETVGTYVEPEDWNALLDDPDTIVVDTRNDYECAIGTFENAVDPKTTNFREFPDWVKRNENQIKGKKIAMFCTGGIRCEKATAFVKSIGHQDVFHLKGGILKYLETVPEADSKWQGECFVFDERVSVGHGLELGTHTLCRACRAPLSPEHIKSPHYKEGISCPFCVNSITEEDRARFAERQKQIDLAKARGERHVGRVLESKKD